MELAHEEDKPTRRSPKGGWLFPLLLKKPFEESKKVVEGRFGSSIAHGGKLDGENEASIYYR